ncbi:MAG: glycosyltransferase family 4 protein [Chloroflexota bacterium]|nr:glycosyltransferase family 4 protein [Chloroflexota bacterium]
MRVALNGYFWDQPLTGSGQYLRHLWTALPEIAGHTDSPDAATQNPTFSLLLPPASTSNEAVPTPPGFSAHKARPLPVGPLPGRSANLDKLLWEEWGVTREAKRRRATLLHSPYLTAPLSTGGLPSVVTAHDMIPWVVPGYEGSLQMRIYLRLAVAGVKKARLIMADSDASRTDIIKVLKVPPRKVRTVYLGMERHPDYTREELDEVRARHGLPEAYAFYLGGFDRRKNVPLLLRAWRAVADQVRRDGGDVPTLAIAGGVPEPGGIVPNVRGQARALGFDGKDSPVRFLGRVSEEDKPRLMSAARLFVYPSACEGFGLDPLEAMSVGCPVVSSSGGSLREVVGDGGLLLPPNDEAALTAAIVPAWRDPALRQALSERGKQQAARFTWQRTAEQTLSIYEEVMRTED